MKALLKESSLQGLYQVYYVQELSDGRMASILPEYAAEYYAVADS